MRVLTSLIIALSVFTGCSKKADSADSDELFYRYYNLENRGWRSKISSQTLNEICFSATDVPIQYYLLKDQGTKDLVSIDSLYRQSAKERIIEFSFQHKLNKNVLDEKLTNMSYDSALKYISFDIQDDFLAVTAKHDTLPCLGVTFERTYDIAPYSRLLLFFDGVPENEDIQLIYNDKLFNNGFIKFKFNEPPIQL